MVDVWLNILESLDIIKISLNFDPKYCKILRYLLLSEQFKGVFAV